MPLVNVRLVEGVFTPEQKREMIYQLTETMVEIEGENLRPVTWVIVEEVKGWGLGTSAETASPPRMSTLCRARPRPRSRAKVRRR
jgi:4-oxalocrotonate tautomerase